MLAVTHPVCTHRSSFFTTWHCFGSNLNWCMVKLEPFFYWSMAPRQMTPSNYTIDHPYTPHASSRLHLVFVSEKHDVYLHTTPTSILVGSWLSLLKSYLNWKTTDWLVTVRVCSKMKARGLFIFSWFFESIHPLRPMKASKKKKPKLKVVKASPRPPQKMLPAKWWSSWWDTQTKRMNIHTDVYSLSLKTVKHTCDGTERARIVRFPLCAAVV